MSPCQTVALNEPLHESGRGQDLQGQVNSLLGVY